MPAERRLVVMAAVHLIVGVVAGLVAPIKLYNRFGLDHLTLVPLFASALCQAALLALWVSASRSSAWMRAVGLVAGAAYLEALFSPELRREFRGISTFTTVACTACLFAIRVMGVRIAQTADSVATPMPEPGGLRFSIRGLIIFTAAVAMLSAGARALQANAGGFLLLSALWALCFVAVGLVALWAALGEARPSHRGPFVFLVAPTLGAFFAGAARAHQAGWAYILLIMVAYSAALLGSLLVVRSCGYRLVRRRRGSPDRSPGGGLDGEPTPLGQLAGGAIFPE